MYNRHEIPPTTKDWVNTDHRRGRAFAPDEVIPFLRATYDVAPNLKGHIEAVHRLSNFGAVVTEVMTGTSQEGFDAEWREIGLFAFNGDLVCRFELFDETDLDAALARFDELHPQAPRLENAASRASDRYLERVVAHDSDAMAEMLADDYYTDDRRHVVGGGIHGRDAEIVNARVGADIGLTDATPTVIATRGERLVLSRVRYSRRDQGLEAFVVEILAVVEINADDRHAAAVAFDLEDIDAAFEELDARYLVGEAAAHEHTWSFISRAYAAFNRHELPPTTPDWVNVDHRRGIAFAPGDMTAYIRAGMDLAPDTRIYIETVHRLNSLGAVITQVLTGTSHDGFDAEWREIGILTFEGDLISRSELYDEKDLDAALARFDELDGSAP
jgi:hypothetical protein